MPLSFGTVGDEPIIGDWNDDGMDDIGVHRGKKMSREMSFSLVVIQPAASC